MSRVGADVSVGGRTVPPEYVLYAEQQNIFNLMQELVSGLLVARPTDPLSFIAAELKKKQTLRTIVIGPPASGKASLVSRLAAQSGCVAVSAAALAQQGSEAGSESALLPLIVNRLTQQDCADKGWILHGFPRTREEALALQAQGILANKVIVLSAPDAVLVERHNGRRIDPLTLQVYHVTYLPGDEEVRARLTRVQSDTDRNLTADIAVYNANADALLSAYKAFARVINADQPLADIFTQAWVHMCTAQRSNAPFIPRVVLVGPPASGRTTHAAGLTKKYGIVHVDAVELVQQHIHGDTPFTAKLKDLTERKAHIPDELLSAVVLGRLSARDCVTQGYVLVGFPSTGAQAHALQKSSSQPNRIFILDTPDDVVRERASLRRIDPVTGAQFHLLDNPPSSLQVQNRLVQHPGDKEDEVLRRLGDYKANLQDLADVFAHSQLVNADQDLPVVFECLDSLLVLPLSAHPTP
eukprot:m.636327 g.636327  ORF g.636327 m.636327 type:complete len:469 (-) comp58307_c0_seq1:149-1555(-)